MSKRFVIQSASVVFEKPNMLIQKCCFSILSWFNSNCNQSNPKQTHSTTSVYLNTPGLSLGNPLSLFQASWMSVNLIWGCVSALQNNKQCALTGNKLFKCPICIKSKFDFNEGTRVNVSRTSSMKFLFYHEGYTPTYNTKSIIQPNTRLRLEWMTLHQNQLICT